MKLKRILKIRMIGEDVTYLQTKLKQHGFFNERVDGNFGQNTLVAVSNFQRAAGLKSDGIVGSLTWSKLDTYGQVKETPKLIDQIPLKVSHVGQDNFKIYDCLLSEEEYYQEEVRKETIYLHHTAGGSRPDWTIGGWEKDFVRDRKGNIMMDQYGKPKALKVGTSYVIGRRSSTTGDDTWDGKIVRAFDDKYWSYHLGVNDPKLEFNSKSIGIEICNYGYLTLGKDGRFYNYVNRPVMDSEVVKLDKPFRGYEYWEKYTDAQIESTRNLLVYLIIKWNIKIEGKIYGENWFDYDLSKLSNGGIRSHTQVRRDKFDIFPQKEMIQMLNSL
jgi:N-acetyl-anhydromuramyl-L-alanine amidase AmpD